jgi:hypothetical protein
MFFPSMRAKILYPYKITGKTAFLDTILFIFSESKLKGEIFWTKWQQTFSGFTLLLIAS